MGNKTIAELEKELSRKNTGMEKIKKRAGSWRDRALRQEKHLKVLIGQYERVLKEKDKIIKEYQENAWKIVFVFLSNIFSKIKKKFS